MSVQAMELPEITPQVISAIKVPVLLIIGDSDIVTPEHAVAMFRLHSHDDDPALPGRTMSR